MPRKPRLEMEGGLYHVIARGNDRRDIFHSDEDHKKFLSLLAAAKQRLPFYLYAYCLMTNHFHLLMERQADTIGRTMQRVLTGYSQYYNRKYHNVGHLFQGRHKAILCQSDRYLSELVRYIHLNPVRAKMVRKAERYKYSSQRAYLGMDEPGVVDVDPVLRLFGPHKAVARERFAEYVAVAAKSGHQGQFYSVGDECILGSDEFVDATIHRLGETSARGVRRPATETPEFDPERLLAAVEETLQMRREDFCGSGKAAKLLLAKEALIVSGLRLGASLRELSEITSLSSSSASRRHDRAMQRMQLDNHLQNLTAGILNVYNNGESK